jgi:hypothetical protein
LQVAWGGHGVAQKSTDSKIALLFSVPQMQIANRTAATSLANTFARQETLLRIREDFPAKSFPERTF